MYIKQEFEKNYPQQNVHSKINPKTNKN